MPLNIWFCEGVMGCDQVRTPEGDFTTCNLTGDLVCGMNLWDCPEVRKAMDQARKMARQEAAAELDRTAGQPLKTYVEKQSLVNLFVSTAEYEQKKMESYLIPDLERADELFERNSTAVEVLGKLLGVILVGTPSLKEVEL